MKKNIKARTLSENGYIYVYNFAKAQAIKKNILGNFGGNNPIDVQKIPSNTVVWNLKIQPCTCQTYTLWYYEHIPSVCTCSRPWLSAGNPARSLPVCQSDSSRLHNKGKVLVAVT